VTGFQNRFKDLGSYQRKTESNNTKRREEKRGEKKKKTKGEPNKRRKNLLIAKGVGGGGKESQQGFRRPCNVKWAVEPNPKKNKSGEKKKKNPWARRNERQGGERQKTVQDSGNTATQVPS